MGIGGGNGDAVYLYRKVQLDAASEPDDTDRLCNENPLQAQGFHEHEGSGVYMNGE